MDIKDFLKQFVEGYLFHDLENLAKIELTVTQNSGALNYPMVLSILSGMELLGFILSTDNKPFSGDTNSGNKYFENYWKNYFSVQEPKYKPLGNVFRQLIRHGIAHTFLTKHGVYISKGLNNKIQINASEKKIYFDSIVFFREFVDSYNNLVRPIIDETGQDNKTSISKMQFKLKSMVEEYETQANKIFSDLNKIPDKFQDKISVEYNEITISGVTMRNLVTRKN